MTVAEINSFVCESEVSTAPSSVDHLLGRIPKFGGVSFTLVVVG